MGVRCVGFLLPLFCSNVVLSHDAKWEESADDRELWIFKEWVWHGLLDCGILFFSAAGEKQRSPGKHLGCLPFQGARVVAEALWLHSSPSESRNAGS